MKTPSYRAPFRPDDLAAEIAANRARAQEITEKAFKVLRLPPPDTFLGRQHYPPDSAAGRSIARTVPRDRVTSDRAKPRDGQAAGARAPITSARDPEDGIRIHLCKCGGTRAGPFLAWPVRASRSQASQRRPRHGAVCWGRLGVSLAFALVLPLASSGACEAREEISARRMTRGGLSFHRRS